MVDTEICSGGSPLLFSSKLLLVTLAVGVAAVAITCAIVWYRYWR